MKQCIKHETTRNKPEPALTVGNPPVLNEEWIEWCMETFGCSREEAIRRGNKRIRDRKPGRRIKP